LETVDEEEILEEEESFSEVFQILNNMENGQIDHDSLPRTT
jgi:hypothetical protein